MVTEKTIVLVDGQAPPRFIPSTRFTLALLVFFAFIVQYSQRVNLPIAIVCMVNNTKVTDRQLPLSVTPRPTLYRSSTTIKPAVTPIEKGGIFQDKQFYWTELQQQFLLGGYWAGYIFTQVPGK
jgi:hypothetical protein